MIRTPLPGATLPTLRVIPCANQLCKSDLKGNRNLILLRGYAYCSIRCRKTWPPTIHRLQKQYAAPIDLILEVGMALFKSKKRVGEVLELGTATLDKLLKIFKIPKR